MLINVTAEMWEYSFDLSVLISEGENIKIYGTCSSERQCIIAAYDIVDLSLVITCVIRVTSLLCCEYCSVAKMLECIVQRDESVAKSIAVLKCLCSSWKSSAFW